MLFLFKNIGFLKDEGFISKTPFIRFVPVGVLPGVNSFFAVALTITILCFSIVWVVEWAIKKFYKENQ